MAMTPSALRADIYRVLDEVLETGQPIEIQRGDRTLVISAKDEGSRLDRLVSRPDAITGDPGDLVDVGWSEAWRP